MIIDPDSFLEEKPDGIIVLLYTNTSNNIVTNIIHKDNIDKITMSEKCFQSIMNQLKQHFNILPITHTQE